MDRGRGSAAARGYDRRWRAYRASFLARYPLCGHRPPDAPPTEDSVCQRERRVVAATVVDHIAPVRGREDPRFYDAANHQALCDLCHNRKRQREAAEGGIKSLRR